MKVKRVKSKAERVSEIEKTWEEKNDQKREQQMLASETTVTRVILGY